MIVRSRDRKQKTVGFETIEGAVKRKKACATCSARKPRPAAKAS